MKSWLLPILVILLSALPVNAEPLVTDIYVQPTSAFANEKVVVRVDEQIVSEFMQNGELTILPSWTVLGIVTTPGVHYIVTNSRTITWVKDEGVSVAHIWVAIQGAPKPGLQVIARDPMMNKGGWITGIARISFPFITIQ